MQTSVTFKNLDPSDHLKGYVREKLDRFDKYLDNPAEATVVLTVEKHRHIVEITITGDRLNLIGKEETADMYSAIDLTLDKIDKQIKKSKEKIRSRRAASRVPAKEMIAEKSAIPEEASGRQVKVKNIEYKPMDI
jgi:putative sigma-54 modulation protein